MLPQVVAVVTNISYANIIWYDGVLSKGPGGTIKGFITLGDSRCLSTFPLQVHAIFCMQPVQMTDVLPRDWSLLSWNLERRHCTQAQIRNIIPRRKGRGILERNLNDKRGQNFWVDLCTYVCFCTCICYITVCISKVETGMQVCLQLAEWQSPHDWSTLSQSHCLPSHFSIRDGFSIFIQVSFAPFSFLNPFWFQSLLKYDFHHLPLQ